MFTRLRQESIDRLDELADQAGVSRSQVVRDMLIKSDKKIKEIEK
jgi:predicted DNA-binding protein